MLCLLTQGLSALAGFRWSHAQNLCEYHVTVWPQDISGRAQRPTMHTIALPHKHTNIMQRTLVLVVMLVAGSVSARELLQRGLRAPCLVQDQVYPFQSKS